MSDVDLWLTIVALSAVTLTTRASMLYLPERFRLPPRVQRALRYAGPCILMAIVVPDLIRHAGAVDVGFDNIRLFAAILAVVVFLITRSAAIMIAVGLLALTVFRLLF